MEAVTGYFTACVPRSHGLSFAQKNAIGLIHTCDFLRRELLREFFSPRNHKNWVHNPLLNFSVHAIVDQITGVNAPI